MESNRNDKYWYVRLDDVPRTVKFPFPLKEFGFFWNKVEPEASFDWKLEFTLRLSSLEQFAVDEIGGVTYRTEYPNVILKLPGVVHKYAIPEPRDAVYFAYSTALADAMTAANLFQMPPVWKIKLTPKICEMLERAKQLMEHCATASWNRAFSASPPISNSTARKISTWKPSAAKTVSPNGPSSVTGNSISIFLQAAIFWTCVYATPRVSCEKHENGSAKSPNP